MDIILGEIDKAIKCELCYSAIVIALKLPDVCAALESKDGRTSKAKYIAWYNTNVKEEEDYLTAEYCYSLRCGVIHQGTLANTGAEYERVLFTIPTKPKSVTLNNNVINNALNLEPVMFCDNIKRSVNSWFNNNANNSYVKANHVNLVQLRRNGLSPYIIGVPLIA